jgi:predicted molibdopterin-dependent oxidoreductase YjgC
VVPTSADRRPSWWIYAQLGHRLGLDLLDGVAPEDCTDEALLRRVSAKARDGVDALFAAGPHGLPTPRLYGWIHGRVLPQGKWNLAPAVLVDRLARLFESGNNDGLVLVSRREVASTNYVRYAPERATNKPSLLVHPEDALTIGVSAGDRVRVSTRAGSVEATVGLDSRYRRGVVSMTHGWTAPNVDDLIDRRANVDPLTGQPAMSGVPVDIELI